MMAGKQRFCGAALDPNSGPEHGETMSVTMTGFAIAVGASLIGCALVARLRPAFSR
jgi:hypothetical protein